MVDFRTNRKQIVYNQLYHYLNDKKLLSSSQSGFRSLHSTLMALLEATNDWSVDIDNGLLNGVVFIDVTKAFDTTDHEIILRKISFMGVDQAAIRWFLSYLSGRTQRCNVNAQTINCSRFEVRRSTGQYTGSFAFPNFLIYNALILPNFDYCSPVWDCLSGYLSDKLQKLQNRAARIITKWPFDPNSDHLLSTIDWERLSIRQ